MKRFFGGVAALALASVGVPALAADMPAKAPIVKAPAPLFDWTGFYVGGYVGVGVQRSRGDDPIGSGLGRGGIDYTGSGFTGGLTAGYNWQFDRHWVVGVEGDIGFLGLSHSVQDWNDAFSYNSKTSWLGTLRARVGYSNGPTLSYVTGGGAFVHVVDSLSEGGLTNESSKTLGGYAYGTGVETMLGGNWTAKAELIQINVGKGDVVLMPTTTFDVQTDHRYSVMKFGVNYLFGGKAQPALPTHNWTGFYAGVIGGSGVAQGTGTQSGTPGVIGENGLGYTFGGIVGYNWQFAPQFVAGVEGDFSWLGIERSQAQYNDFGNTNRNAVLGMKTNWLATARGRLGYSTGPALLYITGGGAWVNVRDDWQGANGNVAGPPVSSTKTLSGFTGGGGIETLFFGNWTSRVEYLYVDVGSGDTLASTASMVVDHKFHVFRSSLTYRFGS